MRTILKSVVFIAALASLAPAADKPNFSGNWVLDADKSNFGPMPAPTTMTRKVDHNDPAMTVEQATTGGAQGDQQATMKYSTDGKETTNNMMGNDVKSTCVWEGNALVVKMAADFGGTEIKITDKWTLSDDGKVLTDLMHLALPQGEFDITYVMNKK
jgi:hypothetical protein